VPSRPTVLFVEDDVAIAEMYRLGLRRFGFDVTVAGDWPAGRVLLGAHRFDVVLLDVMLPGPNGMEVLEEIRADPGLRGVRVAILSNSELSLDIHMRAVSLGILGWLTKSKSPPPLVARNIKRWLTPGVRKA
jgi:two-component system, OmpR family, response regulator